MCGYQDALCNIMPVDWLDPYGRTPFAKDAELSVDITIVETDDGIRAKSVKNPPTSGSSRLMDAIKGALGVDSLEIEPKIGSQRLADQGKHDDIKNNDKKEPVDEHEDSGKMRKPYSPGDSEGQGSQPWSPGKSPKSEDKSDDEDAKGKAPEF